MLTVGECLQERLNRCRVQVGAIQMLETISSGDLVTYLDCSDSAKQSPRIE